MISRQDCGRSPVSDANAAHAFCRSGFSRELSFKIAASQRFQGKARGQSRSYKSHPTKNRF